METAGDNGEDLEVREGLARMEESYRALKEQLRNGWVAVGTDTFVALDKAIFHCHQLVSMLTPEQFRRLTEISCAFRLTERQIMGSRRRIPFKFSDAQEIGLDPDFEALYGSASSLWGETKALLRIPFTRAKKGVSQTIRHQQESIRRILCRFGLGDKK